MFRLILPVPDMLRRLFADLWVPKVIVAIGANILEYLLPDRGNRDMAVAASVLIVIDTLTGLWASFVTGQKISSAKCSRVLSKLLGYSSIVVVCAVAAHAVPEAESLQSIAITGVLAFVTLTEGISIMENTGRMGVKAPPFLLAWLNKRLQQVEADDPIPDSPSSK